MPDLCARCGLPMESSEQYRPSVGDDTHMFHELCIRDLVARIAELEEALSKAAEGWR